MACILCFPTLYNAANVDLNVNQIIQVESRGDQLSNWFVKRKKGNQEFESDPMIRTQNNISRCKKKRVKLICKKELHIHDLIMFCFVDGVSFYHLLYLIVMYLVWVTSPDVKKQGKKKISLELYIHYLTMFCFSGWCFLAINSTIPLFTFSTKQNRFMPNWNVTRTK